jgi:ribonuclease E
MLDNEPTGGDGTGATPAANAADDSSTTRRPRRRPAAKKQAGASVEATTSETTAAEPAPVESKPARRKTASAKAAAEPAAPSRRARKATKATVTDEPVKSAPEPAKATASAAGPATAPRGRRRKATAPAAEPAPTTEPPREAPPAPKTTRPSGGGAPDAAVEAPEASRRRQPTVQPSTAVIFMAPPEAPPEAPPGSAASTAAPVEDADTTRTRRRRGRRAPEAESESEQIATASPRSRGQIDTASARSERGEPRGRQPAEAAPERRRGRRTPEPVDEVAEPAEAAPAEIDEDEAGDDEASRRRRRRGRRGRGRGRGGFEDDEIEEAETEDVEEASGDEQLTRRRRRRRRKGAGGEGEAVSEDGVVTVVKIREPRAGRDEVQGLTGSTRLEAKRQRRRDGREQRRTRPAILSESEFLARREAVDRVMVVRQSGPAGRPNDRTQIAVLEDGVLVEHYVTRQSASTMVGNVYLGKVQNVLPSMEAAFVDIGRGRNAVLYAGEVNWDTTGLEGRARSIEQALKSGDSVLVQVTKDPVGHKGARLTSHVALSGRHLVYVPNGHASGISRKLSDVERRRLRDALKSLVPDGAGVIVRTAAEGAAEDDLARDVKRLQAQWDDIQAKATDGGAPVLLYSEPDLVIRVVRDIFNEDFRELVIQGSDAYDEVEAYLSHVSPDLVSRVRRHTGAGDLFGDYRVDEQILKGLDRKVYLPSGGHLVIDRTEAMTVIDVNTGKYTGAGGNLEETVTRNNLEAAEEIVRQLRLRDLGGIIVIDFIDMVLESNRDLVLRRLTECLGRDRTKHQVTEITSLGLVQMTRKRIGQGLLEAFSEACDHCKGRGVIIHTEPVPERPRNAVAEKVKAVAASARGAAKKGSRRPVEADANGVDVEADVLEGDDLDSTDTDSTDTDRAEADRSDAGSSDADSAEVDSAEVDSAEVDAADATAPGIAEELTDGDLDIEIDTDAGPVRRRPRRGSTRRRTRP